MTTGHAKRSASIAIFLAILFMVTVKAEIPCNYVVTKLFPCEVFLLGGAAGPSAQCCGGAHDLDRIARYSIGNRRAICKCIKAIAQSVPINIGNAKKIPKFCKLSTTIPIDPTINCNAI